MRRPTGPHGAASGRRSAASHWKTASRWLRPPDRADGSALRSRRRQHPRALHVVVQEQLLGIRIQVHLLRYPRCARYEHPVGCRVAVQATLEQRNLGIQGSNSHATRPFSGQLVQPLRDILRLPLCVISGKPNHGVCFPRSRPRGGATRKDRRLTWLNPQHSTISREGGRYHPGHYASSNLPSADLIRLAVTNRFIAKPIRCLIFSPTRS